MLKLKPTVHVDESLLIGRGGVRDVYRHPQHDGRCIKIVHNPKRLRSVKRETRYLLRYERQGKPFDHLTRFHGWCKTNFGAGGVFDLIRDHDGRCSLTLLSHVKGLADPRLSSEEIVEQLTALYHHLFEHQIIVSDPALHNLVVNYRQPGRPKLVIIDGVGNAHFIKLADYRKLSAQRLIREKWRRYIDVNPLLAEVFRTTGYQPLGV